MSVSRHHPSSSLHGAAPPLVYPRCGTLAGLRVAAGTGSRGAEVDAFLGIPYAEPPLGPLRWCPPLPARPWSGVRAAQAFGNDCPQPSMAASRAARQDEDCLYLNVWRPAGAARGSLPVMVWLHGGSFVAGSGSEPRCDGAALAAEGVVVVTLNYRLGVFGFLAHPALARESAHGVSGNYGLLDQLCALRWVHEHIAEFGGDAARVTLFGVSAGASCAALWLGAPAADGLFAQAILQSPGSARPLATLAQAQKHGQQLGNDLAQLRGLPAAELLARGAALQPAVRALTAPRYLRPISDGWLIGPDERGALAAGRIRPLPLIVGGNADEGTQLTAGWGVSCLEAYRTLLRTDFAGAEAEAEAHYPAASDGEAAGAVASLFADTQFNDGVRLIARAMAARGAPTWRYLFSHRRAGQLDGPHHTDEVGFVFGLPNIGADGTVVDTSAEDLALTHSMRRAWTAFARTGDPNVDGVPAWPAYGWPASAKPGGLAPETYLEWRVPARIGSGWRAAQLDFLDGFFEHGRPAG